MCRLDSLRCRLRSESLFDLIRLVHVVAGVVITVTRLILPVARLVTRTIGSAVPCTS